MSRRVRISSSVAGKMANTALPDLPLKEYLKKLVALCDDYQELCYSAFELRNDSFEARLRRNIQLPRIGSIWRAVRHYIGRLGSWWWACTVLVSAAETDPNVFLNCQVKVVPYGAKIATALSQHDQASGDREAMSRLARRQCETYVHAELLVLNYFWRQNLVFADNVPYIGCSKLSCYCCHIYMQLHPCTIISRPCHGNTWARWAMPLLGFNRHGCGSDEDTRLLADMIDRMQQEIETSTSADLVDRQLESTTGISERRTVYYL